MSHYDTLEVSPVASPEVIRAAYRSLMQRFHPDRNPGDPQAAARAAEVARAYEVLSDLEQRARYDAGLKAVGWSDVPSGPAATPDADFAKPTASMAAARRAARPAPTARFGPLLIAAVLLLLGVAVAVAALSLSRSSVRRTDPAAELAAIRLALSSDATPEAERRRLYARKLTLVEHDPELLRRASAERSEDMAARTFALLASPLIVRLSPLPARPGPAVQLTIPAASLLVGSFDAPNLLTHMARHRERLVQELGARLAREDAGRVTGPDAEANLKHIVAQAVNASLQIAAERDYPSTYFESPGAYGVVAVLLPDRFEVVQLESAP